MLFQTIGAFRLIFKKLSSTKKHPKSTDAVLSTDKYGGPVGRAYEHRYNTYVLYLWYEQRLESENGYERWLPSKSEHEPRTKMSTSREQK